jgi:hypothetical protein
MYRPHAYITQRSACVHEPSSAPPHLPLPPLCPPPAAGHCPHMPAAARKVAGSAHASCQVHTASCQLHMLHDRCTVTYRLPRLEGSLASGMPSPSSTTLLPGCTGPASGMVSTRPSKWVSAMEPPCRGTAARQHCHNSLFMGVCPGLYLLLPHMPASPELAAGLTLSAWCELACQPGPGRGMQSTLQAAVQGCGRTLRAVV